MCSSACIKYDQSIFPSTETDPTNLLHDSAGIHLGRQVYDSALHVRSQYLLVDLATMLEEFLDDVVAKDILHELVGIRLNLLEDALLLVAVRRLQLGLDEP